MYCMCKDVTRYVTAGSGKRSKSAEFSDPVVFENTELEVKDEKRPRPLMPIYLTSLFYAGTADVNETDIRYSRGGTTVSAAGPHSLSANQTYGSGFA